MPCAVHQIADVNPAMTDPNKAMVHWMDIDDWVIETAMNRVVIWIA